LENFVNYFRSAGFPPFSHVWRQPFSLALSPLPPLVIGRKTQVAAGHMTTQSLGGKKICWVGGVIECFDCCCAKLCVNLWVSNPRAVAKNYLLYRGSKSNFANEECYITSDISNIEDFHSQRNLAAECNTNSPTVSTCKASCTESKWNKWISL